MRKVFYGIVSLSLMVGLLSLTIFSEVGMPHASTYNPANQSFSQMAASAAGPENFTIIALPDTQFYAANISGVGSKIFSNQTQWVANNVESLKIAFVTHEGDIVDDGGNAAQWKTAAESMRFLDTGNVPWEVLPGNHEFVNDPGLVNYNRYFGYGNFSGRSWYGGAYPASTNTNSFALFSGGNDDYLIFNFQYRPSDAVLAWANNTITAYPNRRVIVTTHDYMDVDGSRTTEGNHIWNGFVAPHANQVFLVLCGHNHGEARRTDVVNGHTVYQLLADYQSEMNGGNGWLRILQFRPAEDKVLVKTFSPYLNSYESDANSEFVFDYEMTSSTGGAFVGTWAYSASTNTITVTGGTSGAPAGFVDAWNADKAGTYTTVNARNIAAADGAPVAVTNALRPTDLYVLGGMELYITVTNYNAPASTINIVGTDAGGNAINENITVNANGNYNTTLYYRTVTTTQVTAKGGNFTYTMLQGQWGVVWKQATNQFAFDCKIVVGDGSTATYFSDSNKQVVFSAFSLSAESSIIYVMNGATVNFGLSIDSTLKTSKMGVSFISNLVTSPDWEFFYLIRAASGSVTNLYSCSLVATSCRHYLTLRGAIWNSNLGNRIELSGEGESGGYYDVYNVVVSNGYTGITQFSGTVSGLYVFSCRHGVTFNTIYTSSCTISNLVVRNSQEYGLNCYYLKSGTSVYLINPDIDSWAFVWSSGSGTLYRQYQFDLNVLKGNMSDFVTNANVTLSKNGTVLGSWLTNSSGMIPTQMLTYGYYNSTGGNTMYDGQPFTLNITSSDWASYSCAFNLTAKTNWTIALQPLTDIGLIKHVGLVPVDPGLTAPSGTYRWLDVADQAYGIGYRNSYNYSQSAVEVAYCKEGNKLQGLLNAINLKPNFAYQLKLVGTPGTADNERIGLVGRWWQEEWNGTAWDNGQNLNDKGDGSSPNPNDQTYLSRRYMQDSSSPTGYHYRYTGYLVFNYFITDIKGTALIQFETGGCYHVIWKTNQRSQTLNDGPAKTVTFDPTPLQPAYDSDYPSNTVSIFGEWERLPMGQVNLQPGEYNCQILLTEESFHGSGGTLAGNWAGAVTANIMFTIN